MARRVQVAASQLMSSESLWWSGTGFR
jgi:hypothetical protein